MFTSLCQFQKTLARTSSETVFAVMFTDFPPVRADVRSNTKPNFLGLMGYY